MKRIVLTAILLPVAVTLAGCSGLHITQPDYDHLPGSGNTAPSGPGLFDHTDGYTFYSSDPSKKSLLGPGSDKAKKQSQSSDQTTASQNNVQPTQVSQGYVPQASEREQFQRFQEFQAYQRYQKFKNSSNASDRKKFKEWKDWQQYKKWKQQSNQQPTDG